MKQNIKLAVIHLCEVVGSTTAIYDGMDQTLTMSTILKNNDKIYNHLFCMNGSPVILVLLSQKQPTM